jgi:hypothetical protein
MLSGDSRVYPRWTLAGQLQCVCVRVSGDHPAIQARVEELITPLVGSEDQAPSDVLEFSLNLLPNGEPGPSMPTGSKALIQFASVSCFQSGPSLSFHTRDGSVLKADIQTGRVSGTLSREITTKRGVFTDLLLAPLMEMLKHRGFYGLHAAALAREGTGYLFPGDAGSGKTTTALGLVKEGFQYLADDKVLLREEDGGVAALAFTRRFNIDPGISRHYPELSFLEGLEPLPGTTKRPIDISRVYPNTFVPRCRPRFVIHLQLAPEAESRIVRLSRAESFGRLVHQTILSFQKEIAMKQLKLLGDLVRHTESYLLCSGKDLYAAPERLLELLPGFEAEPSPLFGGRGGE